MHRARKRDPPTPRDCCVLPSRTEPDSSGTPWLGAPRLEVPEQANAPKRATPTLSSSRSSRPLSGDLLPKERFPACTPRCRRAGKSCSHSCSLPCVALNVHPIGLAVNHPDSTWRSASRSPCALIPCPAEPDSDPSRVPARSAFLCFIFQRSPLRRSRIAESTPRRDRSHPSSVGRYASRLFQPCGFTPLRRFTPRRSCPRFFSGSRPWGSSSFHQQQAAGFPRCSSALRSFTSANGRCRPGRVVPLGRRCPSGEALTSCPAVTLLCTSTCAEPEACRSCHPEGPSNPHPKRSRAPKVHQPPCRLVVRSG